MARKPKTVSTIRCDVCRTSLSQNCWEQHIKGKRHEEALSRQNTLTECTKRSLFVVGFPVGTTQMELVDYFSKFASVSDIFMDKKEKKYAILELDNRAGADRIFCQNHLFKNSWLTVKRRSIKPNRSDAKGDSSAELCNRLCVDMNDVKQQLISAPDFEAQFLTLVKVMSATEAEANQKMEVCKAMENMMKDFFPNCQAVPYGSNVSRLGTSGCDLDIFVDLKISPRTLFKVTNDDEMKILNTLRNDLRHTRKNPTVDFIEQVECLEPRKVVQLLSTIIKKYFSGTKNVIPIKSTRCPIVTFYMNELGFECDVSIKNGLGVHNSVLIASYCKSDPRVLRVLFAIRVWAKLAGVCDGKSGKFSSYAITMLGLFYLQNCDPPVVASVATLQSLADSPILCNNWECQFCMDPSKIPPQSNTETDGQLFKGFFQFYSQHSLSDMVVCLKTAKFISKEEFILQIESDETIADFKVKIFNIQDPFELSFNLATNLIQQTADDWVTAIKTAHEFLSDISELEKRDDQPWGLSKLLFCLTSSPATPSALQPLLRKSKPHVTEETSTQNVDPIPVEVVPEMKSCGIPGDFMPHYEIPSLLSQHGMEVEHHVIEKFNKHEEANLEVEANINLNEDISNNINILDNLANEAVAADHPEATPNGVKSAHHGESVQRTETLINTEVPNLIRRNESTPVPLMALKISVPPPFITAKSDSRFQPYNIRDKNYHQTGEFSASQSPRRSPRINLHSVNSDYFDKYCQNNWPPSDVTKGICPPSECNRLGTVTPSKPQPSRITPISQSFQVVTCSKNSCIACRSLHANSQPSEDGPATSVKPQLQPCNMWSYDVMRRILSEGLRINCEVLADVKDCSDPDRTPVLILCTVYHNTWVDRNAARTAVGISEFISHPVANDPIISEGKVSDYLIKKYPPLTSDPLFICHCFLINFEHENQTKLDVHLDLITTMNKEFVNFVTFLKSFSQKIFTRLNLTRQLTI